MASDNRPFLPLRLVLGIVTFLVGALFVADAADLLRADSALAFWPVGLVALGLVVVLQPDTGNRLLGAVLLVAGVWLLLNAIGVWTYRFWATWPYLLMLFGAWMLYRANRMRTQATRDGWVTGFAFLNSVERQESSAPLAAGDVSAVAGECAIDLRGAQAAHAVTVIDVFALFGRIVLHVPAGWQVETRILPLAGSVDALRSPGAGGPTVVVQGSTICGRVAITQGEQGK
jgi:predicted membrane protein